MKTDSLTNINDFVSTEEIDFSVGDDECNYSDIKKNYQTKDGILILDSSGTILNANSTACYFLGFSEKEILGVSIENFFVEALFFINGNWDKAESNSICFEKFLFNESRKIICTEINIYSLEPEKIFVIIRDNTSLKNSVEQNRKIIEELKFKQDLLEEQSAELIRLSHQLSESEERLKELIIEKDKFFSIMAHDIKSPFSGLLGLSNILYEECDSMDKDKLKEYLFHMENLIKNQYRLIENLLDWSRLQSGRMKCEPVKINAADSLLYICSLISQNAATKSISINNNVQNKIYVRADERMLNSVFENVLANAIKFTPTGGSVVINSSIEKDYLNIIIKDSGVGMSPEVLRKIFRIDVSHSSLGTEKEKGTGLGLIMCKEMMEKQEGSITVNSVIGKGTEVSIKLSIWGTVDEAEQLNPAINKAE